MTREAHPPAKARVVALARPADQKGKGAMKDMAGSDYDEFNRIMLAQVASTIARYPNEAPADYDARIHAVAAAMSGSGPTSEIEGMLMGQMIALNNAAMECFRRAMIPTQPAQYRATELSLAIKATRAYGELLLALDKHRGKGVEQRVTVEHVHVHAGGQAIVGAVATPGVPAKRSEQPHAPERAKG